MNANEPNHPLDPLTPDEVGKASAAVRATHDLGPGLMFETVTLREPDKATLAAFRPGAPFARPLQPVTLVNNAVLPLVSP